MESKNPPHQFTDLSGHHRLRILAEHYSVLEILDKKSNQTYLMNPLDIILEGTYKNFSNEDILRVGFICGQLSNNFVE